MSDTSTQATGNTQPTGGGQTVAGAAAPAAGGVTTGAAAPAAAPAAASSAPATTSQQATEGQTAAGTTAAAASTEGGTEGAKPAAAGAPEKYEFKAPEGVVLDDSVVGEFSAVAKELGLPQDAAQKVIDKLAPALAKQNMQSLQSLAEQANTTWVEAVRSDKEIGGDKLQENLAVARKALDRFGSPELRALLGKFDPKDNPMGTGLGNHPAIIKAFLKAGQAISEDKVVAGTTAPGKGAVDAAKSLYPQQA